VRKEAFASRATLTDRLVAAIGRCTTRPKVLVGGSGINFYGDRGDELLDESSTQGRGMLAELCHAWEQAALAAKEHGVRVVCLRIGVVLGTDGGAFPPLATTTRLGVGATFGAGRQYMSWIHRSDLVEMFTRAIVDDRWHGPMNATAPAPATNRELADTLARVMRRPRLLRVPAFALYLALGEAREIVLASLRVMPTKALELGFEFAFPDLERAFVELVHGPGRLALGPARDCPDVAPLREQPPSHRLDAEIAVDRPLAEVWAFFQRPRNLAGLTPGDQGFELVGDVPDSMHPGGEIVARVGLGPLKVRWTTRIDAVEHELRFRDSQAQGPFAVWVHEHEFRADGPRTTIVDRVFYTPPFGVLGRAAHPLAIAPRLRALFAHRHRCLRLRFGEPPSGPPRAS
jgi:uncharacterized protein (TIGR01777 family)